MSIRVASGDRQTPNQYIVDIIESKRLPSISKHDPRIKPLVSYVKDWAGKQLADLFVAGSSAKGTSLKGSSDLDLFVSLKADTGGTLEEIFSSFYDALKSKGFAVRKQNVSVRVKYNGLQIDFVPGKRLPYKQDWHFLHTNRRSDQYRIQTNVANHINTVLSSNKINEIIALKIWRDCNRLDLPSMYLEMYVLKALARKWTGKSQLTENFLFLLEEIANYFPNAAVYDPSNTTNTISDTLTKTEKKLIQNAAIKSLERNYLSEIIY